LIFIAALALACEPLPAKAPDESAATSADATAQPAPEAAPAADPNAAHVEVARQRAQDWLALVDQGQYAQSWDVAAPLFQSSTTKQQWEGAVQGARNPLGALGKREPRGAEYKTSLPGAPAGEYVVVYYDSAFANKAAAREVVTLMRGADDSWKVVGYFVQ
jgi:hypothetical protein